MQADDERSMDPTNKAFYDAFENIIEGGESILCGVE